MIKETVKLKKLSEIPVGVQVKIHSLDDDHIVLKLMEMGCLPGEILSVVNKAPWGDPISILISGYLLSLRVDEAEKINVLETNNH
jgi:ferrous iron transport protein A